MELKQRLEQLKKARSDLPGLLHGAAREATMQAVEAAAAATPSKDDAAGAHTRTGDLKAHWATDSRTEPEIAGREYKTQLANSMEYASYVNDGRRMDRHFVPGLYVNPYSGLLEYDPARNVGIIVGAKTKYVPGEFMTDKAEDAYRKTASSLLNGALARALK